MKLQQNQSAPNFRVADVFGRVVDLKNFAGKKVYLAFERNAGCPVCNLRTHNLLKQADFFAENNTVVIMVYESTVEKMKEYLGPNNYPFYFVADPDNVLYNQYGVERSLLKVMGGLFHGLLGKVREGKKLYDTPMKQDGHADRVPAEFVIRENGTIASVNYGKFLGDHLPLSTLQTALA
jgi:thioredoxin-dependent peroxiredoxin